MLTLTVVVGAVVSVGSAYAGGETAQRDCAAAPTSLRAGATTPNAMRALTSSALHQYDDYIEDVVSAPDICGTNIVTNDNVSIVAGIHVHDRSRFSDFDAYSILLDTDSNPATGAVAHGGAEYVIDISDEASSLSAWDGSTFAPVAPQPSIPTVWLEDYGPLLVIGRAALDDPQTFNVTLRTTNGSDRDFAPDSGSWSYAITPLQLTPGGLHVGPARAGRQLVASMEVLSSDFDIPLNEGTVTCRATVAGKQLSGRRLSTQDLITCAWRVPASARGKLVRGSVAVTFQGVTARRAFSVRTR